MWRGFCGCILGDERNAEGGARLGGIQQLPTLLEAFLLELPFHDGSETIRQVVTLYRTIVP